MPDNNNQVVQTNRFNSFDFLKFIAAIMIVFHHFQQVTNTKFVNGNFYFGRIYFGYLVEFFFIISGFLTAFSLSHKPIKSFKTFMLGKAIRIYPMAMLSVVATFCIFIFYYRIIGQAPAVLGIWHLVTSLTCTFVRGGA